MTAPPGLMASPILMPGAPVACASRVALPAPRASTAVLLSTAKVISCAPTFTFRAETDKGSENQDDEEQSSETLYSTHNASLVDNPPVSERADTLIRAEDLWGDSGDYNGFACLVSLTFCLCTITGPTLHSSPQEAGKGPLFNSKCPNVGT